MSFQSFIHLKILKHHKTVSSFVAVVVAAVVDVFVAVVFFFAVAVVGVVLVL